VAVLALLLRFDSGVIFLHQLGRREVVIFLRHGGCSTPTTTPKAVAGRLLGSDDQPFSTFTSRLALGFLVQMGDYFNPDEDFVPALAYDPDDYDDAPGDYWGGGWGNAPRGYSDDVALAAPPAPPAPPPPGFWARRAAALAPLAAGAASMYYGISPNWARSLSYVAAGVGAKAAGKALDWVSPTAKKVAEAHLGGGQGRRRLEGKWKEKAKAQAASRVKAGESYASDELRKAAVERAVAEEKAIKDEEHRWFSGAARKGFEVWNKTDMPDYRVEEARHADNATASQYASRLREARRKVATASAIPVESKSVVTTGKRDSDMRRYARDHRRRMRVIRYAKQMPAERFLAAMGASRGVRKGLKYHR